MTAQTVTRPYRAGILGAERAPEPVHRGSHPTPTYGTDVGLLAYFS